VDVFFRCAEDVEHDLILVAEWGLELPFEEDLDTTVD
jgi:hypothetical protein